MLKDLLAHPLTRGLNIDSPRCTDLRWSLIRNKRFLRQIYEEWYAAIAAPVSYTHLTLPTTPYV